jgi:hypothetical protein
VETYIEAHGAGLLSDVEAQMLHVCVYHLSPCAVYSFTVDQSSPQRLHHHRRHPAQLPLLAHRRPRFSVWAQLDPPAVHLRSAAVRYTHQGMYVSFKITPTC